MFIPYPAPVGPATTRAPPPGFFCEQMNCAAQAGLPSTATWRILNVGGAARCYPISSWTFCGSPPSDRGLFFLVALTIWQPTRPTCRRPPPHARSITGSAGVMSTFGRSDLRVHNPKARQSFACPLAPNSVASEPQPPSSLLRLDPDKSGRWARTLRRSWLLRTHRDQRCGTVLWSDKPWIRGDGRGTLVSLSLLR